VPVQVMVPIEDTINHKGSCNPSSETGVETQHEGVASTEVEVDVPVVESVQQTATTPLEELGRGHRKKITSVKLKYYVTYNASALVTPDKHIHSTDLTGVRSLSSSTVP